MRTLAGIVIALVLIVGAAIVAFFVPRFSNAYVALEATEAVYAGHGADAERVRLANAMVENEPPRGLTLGPRIHPVGTLAHVRYETLARSGEVVSTTEVRALAPPLPYFGIDAPGGPYGRIDCPQACREALVATGGSLIDRGGSPGLAAEWILRMPVGKAFELPSESPNLQDIEDRRPISLPVARYRVTLLEACPAEVRMGSLRTIDFAQNAIVPIPTGLRFSNWVQVGGCAALMAKKPARPEPAPPPAAVSTVTPEYAYRPPELGLILPRHESPMGRATLVVDESFKLKQGVDMQVRILAACRYDVAARSWSSLPVPADALERRAGRRLALLPNFGASAAGCGGDLAVLDQQRAGAARGGPGSRARLRLARDDRALGRCPQCVVGEGIPPTTAVCARKISASAPDASEAISAFG